MPLTALTPLAAAEQTRERTVVTRVVQTVLATLALATLLSRWRSRPAGCRSSLRSRSPTWCRAWPPRSLISFAIAGVAFVFLRGTFNMDEIKAQQEPLNREKETLKKQGPQKIKVQRPGR